MFTLRSGGQGGPGPAQTPSIESIRRQARHRLIGASVLVLVGIIGLPLLFDSQPRPVPVDIRIEIPDRQTAPPLALADAQPPSSVTVAPEPVEEVLQPSSMAVASVVPAPATPPAVAPPVTAPTPSPAPAAQAPEPPASASGSKVAVAPASPARPAAAPAPANVAPPLSAPVPTAPTSTSVPATVRLVVQVGAFAEEARAQEVRQRLERAGLRTYTQVANTPDGPRIRVRLGPFNSRGEAEQASQRVQQLGLPASILTL